MSQDRISLGTNSDGARHFTIRLRHPHTQLVGLKYPLYYISNLLYHTLIKHDLKLVRNTTAKYTASCFHNHLSLLLPPPMMVYRFTTAVLIANQIILPRATSIAALFFLSNLTLVIREEFNESKIRSEKFSGFIF